MLDRELALKHWKAFWRKLGKHKQFHFVAVIEEQARGALHFHVAVAGRQMYALLRSIWQGILGRGPNGEQMGQVHVRDPHRFGFGVAGAHKIASYIAKYCGKEMQCRALDQKRYFRSRGIVVPEVDVWRVPFCTHMLRAGRSHFRRFPAIAWTACRPGATTISASCTWQRLRDCHRWWTIVRSDSYSTLIDGEEGRDMANFDANTLRVLEQIEDEFRNQYWIIRNSRRTNWRAVNRTRMLGDFMYMLGVPKWAVQQARYCLRLRV